MEPVTIATTAGALLSPYLIKAGEKAAETIGENLPAKIGTVWKAITSKFRGQPVAEKAVTNWVAQPNDKDNEAAFRKELRDILKADPTFMNELAQLLAAVQPERGDQILNTGSGAVATRGGIAAGAGGTAIKGDLHGGIVMGGTPKKE